MNCPLLRRVDPQALNVLRATWMTGQYVTMYQLTPNVREMQNSTGSIAEKNKLQNAV
jgi:hypothetical protein